MQQAFVSAGPPGGIAQTRRLAEPVLGRLAWIGFLLLLAAFTGSAMFPGRAPHAITGAPALSGGTAAPPPGFAAPPPLPEPLKFEAIGAEDARLINMRTPFEPTVGAIAAPFFARGTLASQARAVDCLASAMWYEAGNSDLGQRAVAQVVLNRVRHPAFPNTVCGVVFQGSDRSTGCQFTFTCDGALARRPSAGGFALARLRAQGMLAGGLVPQVGLATHYHTDWVHPVWSAQMDKLAQVDTHLFFRWDGAWGKAPAFRQVYGGEEPTIARLATISEAHREGAAQPLDGLAPDLAETALAAANTAPVALAAGGRGAREAAAQARGPLTITMMPGGNGGPQSYQALRVCDGRATCKVNGYVDGAPGSLAFVYVRDRRDKWIEVMLWDCKVFPRTDASECISGATQKWVDYKA